MIKCSHCAYEYTPRKDTPKSCPMCKQYYARVGYEIIKETDKTI